MSRREIRRARKRAQRMRTLATSVAALFVLAGCTNGSGQKNDEASPSPEASTSSTMHAGEDQQAGITRGSDGGDVRVEEKAKENEPLVLAADDFASSPSSKVLRSFAWDDDRAEARSMGRDDIRWVGEDRGVSNPDRQVVASGFDLDAEDRLPVAKEGFDPFVPEKKVEPAGPVIAAPETPADVQPISTPGGNNNGGNTDNGDTVVTPPPTSPDPGDTPPDGGSSDPGDVDSGLIDTLEPPAPVDGPPEFEFPDDPAPSEPPQPEPAPPTDPGTGEDEDLAKERADLEAELSIEPPAITPLPRFELPPDGSLPPGDDEVIDGEPGSPNDPTTPGESDENTPETPADEPSSPAPVDEPASPAPVDEPSSPAPVDEPSSPAPVDEPSSPVPGAPVGDGTGNSDAGVSELPTEPVHDPLPAKTTADLRGEGVTDPTPLADGVDAPTV